METWLALDRTGAAANSVYGATDEAYIADIYYAASAQTVAKAADVLGLEETKTGISEIADRQWRAVKERIFYFHRKMCGEDADRAYPCAGEVSSV